MYVTSLVARHYSFAGPGYQSTETGTNSSSLGTVLQHPQRTICAYIFQCLHYWRELQASEEKFRK